MNQAIGEAHWQVPACDIRFWHGRSCAWCVVIPVIDEGRRLGNLLHRMERLRIEQVADILIIDGGSTDGSLARPMLEHCGVRGLLVKTGAGRLSAQLRCAYAFALREGYRGIVTIDGNDKDDPEAIPRFVSALAEGLDFVQASRFVPGGMARNTPLLRYLAIRCIHAPLLRLASGFPWTDTTQGLRGYSARLLLDPQIAPFREVFQAYELLAYLSCKAPRAGYACIELPSARCYPAGEVPSRINGLKGHVALLVTLLKACCGRYDKST